VYCTLSLTLTLDGGGWSAPRPGPIYCQEREPVPILQKAGCAPGPVWLGVKIMPLTGIQSLDHPASIELLYLSSS
jgi:hypothetical protein